MEIRLVRRFAVAGFFISAFHNIQTLFIKNCIQYYFNYLKPLALNSFISYVRDFYFSYMARDLTTPANQMSR